MGCVCCNKETRGRYLQARKDNGIGKSKGSIQALNKKQVEYIKLLKLQDPVPK